MPSILSARACSLAVAALMILGGCTQLTRDRLQVDYYPVSGNSTKSIDRAIRRNGPKVNGGRHAIAVARIKMVPNIRFQPTSNGCTISSAKVAVDARVTLPRWTPGKGASRKLRRAWKNVDQYARLHEGVHVAIAKEYARGIEKSLRGMRSRKNCSVLQRRAAALLRKRLAAHDRAQKKFDANEQRRFKKLASGRRRKA